MQYTHALIFSLLSFCATHNSFSKDYTFKEKISHCKNHLKKSQSAYIASLLVSTGIGALTGGAIAYLEKKYEINPSASPVELFLLLLGWSIESEIRNDLIYLLQRNMDDYEISHKKSLMFKVAWITSWFAYLQTL